MAGNTKYFDLTASELGYLAGHGSEEAWEALTTRGERGDVEAVQFLNTGEVGGDFGDELAVDDSDVFSYEGEENMGGCNSCASANPYPYFVGDDSIPAPQTTPLDMMMPHRLLDQAVNQAAARYAPQLNQPFAQPYGQPANMPVVRRVPAPVAARGPVRPIARLPLRRPPTPLWGVFIDFQDQPAEIFATLKQANEWAKSVDAAGVPAFVVHAGDEPPRAPFGYQSVLEQQMEMPYGSTAQDISSSSRAPSAYELYQLAQGQRI